MAITWGDWEGTSTNRFRVGIDLTTSGSTITDRYYVECTANVDDEMTLTISGARSLTRTFRMSKGSSGGTTAVGSFTRTGTPGTSLTFRAGLSGVYNGATPAHSRAITVPASPPGAPGTPRIDAVTHSSVTATFEAPSSSGGSGIVEHQYQIATNSSFTNQVTAPQWASTRTYTITGLNPSTTYYIRARERNSAGWGAWGYARQFKTLAALPGAPGAPSISAVSSSSLSYSFTAASGNGATILEYQVQYSKSSSFSSTSTTSAGTSRSGTLTGLSRYTTYWARARARTAQGWGPWSSAGSARTLAAAPTIANTATATQLTRNSVVITGSSVSDTGGQAPTNLRVQYNTTATESGALIATRGSWAEITLSGLTAATRYYYRVSASNSAGWSGYSPWQSFTTLSSAPDDMAPPTFSSISESGVTIGWTMPEANGSTISTIRWEVSRTDTFETLSAVGTSLATSVTIGSLRAGTQYYVRTRALATPNNGGWGAASFTTVGAVRRGLRIFTFVGGVRRELRAYTFVGGVRRELDVMYQRGNVLEAD